MQRILEAKSTQIIMDAELQKTLADLLAAQAACAEMREALEEALTDYYGKLMVSTTRIKIAMPVSVPPEWGACYPNHANIYLQHDIGMDGICKRCRKSFRKPIRKT